MAAFTLDLRNLDRVRAKLQTVDSMLSRPWRAVMDQAGQVLVQEGAVRGPGTIGQGFTKVVDSQPVPRFAMAKLSPVPTGEDKKRTRFPFVLNAGKGGPRTFHYRSGRFRGRPTAGWIMAAVKSASRKVGPLLRAAAKGIESEWQR